MIFHLPVLMSYLDRNPIFWSFKKQKKVTRSSTEVEYMSVANATIKLNWLYYLLTVIVVFNYLGVPSYTMTMLVLHNSAPILCFTPEWNMLPLIFTSSRTKYKMMSFMLLVYLQQINLLMHSLSLFIVPTFLFFYLKSKNELLFRAPSWVCIS